MEQRKLLCLCCSGGSFLAVAPQASCRNWSELLPGHKGWQPKVGTFWGPFQLMLGPLAWGIKGHVFSGSVCCSSGIFILVSTLGFQVSGVLPLGLHPMQEAELKAVAALSCSPSGDAAVEPRPCRVGLAVKSSTR